MQPLGEGSDADGGLVADGELVVGALPRRAADTYVLASAEKIGAASRFTVLPLAAVSAMVTDAPPDDPTVQQLITAGACLISPGDAHVTANDTT